MLIKAGVDISRLNPEIRGVLGDAADILIRHHDEIVVTSTFEGSHMPESYHYCNDAFDFTGRYDLSGVWADRLREKTPSYVDVVFESNHIHVELDRHKLNKLRGF